MAMKQIKVSEQVHEELNQLKEAEGHTSFDSALRELLYQRTLNEVSEAKRASMFRMATERKDRGNFSPVEDLPPEDVDNADA